MTFAAIPSPSPNRPRTPGKVMDSPVPTPIDHSRHPSPWHEVAHNLSTTSLPPLGAKVRRSSTPSDISTPPMAVSVNPNAIDQIPDLEQLSTSQALRDWERLLALPDSDVRRHQLIHPSPLPTPDRSAPKLAAERDKEGHIEYKLKLIDPTPERFERLVTQMMWRLKQGRNEAIYELGLADDGTVIGLTRPEMDASLKTLELMASEVGATVMILKEIVLTGATTNPPIRPLIDPAQNDGNSLSSSAISMSSSGHSPNDGSWVIRRPDLDENGKPRKGTRTLSAAGPEGQSRKREKGDGAVKQYSYKPSQTGKSRPIIFDPDNNEASDVSSDSGSPVTGPSSTSESISPRQRTVSGVSGSTDLTEDDPPTFVLDLEEPPPAPQHSMRHIHRWRDVQDVPKITRTVRPLPTQSQEQREDRERKAEVKRLKSAMRREQRRLDLLRGDGMSPSPFELPRAGVGGEEPSSHGSVSSQYDLSEPLLRLAKNYPLSQFVHQPARPSSLRLASPKSSPDETFHDSLLHVPLDSLSLSFADVRTVTGDDIASVSASASSPSNDTEYAGPIGRTLPDLGASTRWRPPPPGEEMICVEALVVRKVQHEEGEGDVDGGEDDAWGFGGEDDGWGFGGEDDD